MKFEELYVGLKFIDKGSEFDDKSKAQETVVELTSNSVLITQTRTSDKGINCTSWVAGKDIEKRFKQIVNA